MDDNKKVVLELIEDMFYNVLKIQNEDWINEYFEGYCDEYELTEEQQDLIKEVSYHVDEIIKILK